MPRRKPVAQTRAEVRANLVLQVEQAMASFIGDTCWRVRSIAYREDDGDSFQARILLSYEPPQSGGGGII